MEEKALLRSIGQILEEKLEEKLEQKLDQKLVPIHGRVDNLADRVDNLADKMDNGFKQVDKRFEQMDNRFDKVEGRLDRIEVVIENELRPHIQRLAEGYESLPNRVRDLEVDVTELNAKVDPLILATISNSKEINLLKSL